MSTVFLTDIQKQTKGNTFSNKHNKFDTQEKKCHLMNSHFRQAVY